MAFRKGINDSEYLELAKSKQSVLNTANLEQARILDKNSYFLIYNLEDQFKYERFDGFKVVEHFLILPLDDDFEPSHSVVLEDKALFDIEERAKSLNPNDYFIFWESRGGRSIKKWHAHVIFVELQQAKQPVTLQVQSI